MAGSCSGFPLTESYDSHVWLLFNRLLQPLLLLVLFLFIQLFDRGNFEDGHDVWTERIASKQDELKLSWSAHLRDAAAKKGLKQSWREAKTVHLPTFSFSAHAH